MQIPTHATLAGQVALVSGANRGLGAAIALELANRGATVYAGARDPTTLEGLDAQSDGAMHALTLDVTNDEQIEAAVAHVAAKAGRLDILVNNAGVGDWHGTTLQSLDPGMLDKVLATNLRGPILLAKAALPHLLKHRGSRVVNMSSGMGALEEGMSGSAPAYRISKTGLNGLTAYLAGEYAQQGLIANSVCPGWVRTDMGGPNAQRDIPEGADTPVWLACFQEGAPSGKFWRDRQVIPF